LNFSQITDRKKSIEKNLKKFRIKNKLRKLSESSAEGKDIDTAVFKNLQMVLRTLEQEKCKGAILRSKAKWAVESDKCTKLRS